MSFVVVSPSMLEAAVSEITGIGSALSAANTAAAGATTDLVAAAADEVSVGIVALFGSHAAEYRAVSAQAAAFQSQFLQALNAGAGAYASAEVASAAPLDGLQQVLLNLINAPAQGLFGRPLIGNGANGAPGLSLIHI